MFGNINFIIATKQHVGNGDSYLRLEVLGDAQLNSENVFSTLVVIGSGLGLP